MLGDVFALLLASNQLAASSAVICSQSYKLRNLAQLLVKFGPSLGIVCALDRDEMPAKE